LVEWERRSEMTEQNESVELMKKEDNPDREFTISVIAIIAVSVIILACIFSCTLIAYLFFLNPPW
jgi:hypothetical protein